jgi:DNA-directed RNA polymerase subunit RPC12/RpoP
LLYNKKQKYSGYEQDRIAMVKKMTNQKDISYALCFNCAAVYSLSDTSQYKCPYCKHSVDAELYKEVIDYAKTAVHFGYNYRKKYEDQIQTQGEINAHYCLSDPSSILCFIGIAALSGIIGNLSYDIVKKVIGKIIRSSKKVDYDIDETTMQLLNDFKIKIFVQYIQEFHTDSSTAVIKVKQEVEKERFIFSLTKTLYPAITGGNTSREQIHDAFLEAFNKYHNFKKPSHEVFDSFWQDINNK